jgi:multiple sugar transport system permease protein
MTSRMRRSALLSHIVLVGVVALTALPLLWAVKAALGPAGEVFSTGVFELPSRISADNFVTGLTSAPFALYFLNSAIVAVGVTVTTVVTSVAAGYGFARFQFPGRGVLFGLVIVALMLPFQAIMIPLFLEIRTFGWLSNYLGIMAPGLVSAFGVFLMRQYMQQLPRELFDAARMDGASEWRTFRSVALPLARAPIAALGALTFLGSWNNFLWPLIVIQRETLTTLPLALVLFRSQNKADYAQILAVSLVAAVPVIILFLVMRRGVLSSFATSGIK